MRLEKLAQSDAREDTSRQWVRAFFVFLLGCSVLAPSARSQGPQIQIAADATQAPSTQLATALQRRGDLELRGSTLDAALFTINELWKVNIIAGQVEGEVNGVFKDAPLKEILDSILLGNGYGYRMVGDSIVVSRLEQLGQINPFFVSEAIPVNNSQPSELVEAARLLSTPQGKVEAIDTASSLIVIDFPERVKMIRDLVASVDAATRGPGMLDSTGRPKSLEVGYFHTQYVTIADAKKLLATVLGPVGRVEAVDGEDRLIVVDFAENLRMAERVLVQFDRPRPQVEITALIYDLSLEDIEQLGINWGQAVNARTNGSVSNTEVAIGTPFGTNASGSLFTFTHTGDTFDLFAIAQAVQEASDSRLLANPNVTVMDNEQANFEAVTQIPYQQITQTGQGGQLAGTAFKDAGIKLDVLPKIAADGTVELTVRPEFSRLTGFTPGDSQPIIDTRATSTTVRVANGQTLVIGGMRQRSDVGDFAGVPGLKDIRWWGHLFRSRSTNIRESELVVFITPRIVGYTESLNCRHRMVKDTIDCRLDHIPRAEGCPHCGSGYCNGGCCEYIGSPSAFPVPPNNVPEEVPAEPLHSTPQAYMAPTQPAATSSSVAPLPQFASAPRRLPAPPGISQAFVATESSDERSWRLRRDYDARFQATGGVYANQQRQQERKPEQVEVAQQPEKKTWMDRVLFR